jgi:hypothetical protein
LAALTQIADYSEKKNQLDQLRRRIDRTGLQEVVTRIDTALTTLQSNKRALEAKQLDAEILAQVSVMRENDTLAALRSNLEKLDKLDPHADSTKSKINAKRASLARAVEQEEAFAAGLSVRTDAVRDGRGAKELRETILRTSERFRGTAEQEQLDAAVQRCDRLEECFQALRQLDQADVPVPDSLQVLESQYDALLSDNVAWLCDSQQLLVRASRESLVQRAAAKRTDASKWLNELEKRASRSDAPDRLLGELANPPAFLPEADLGRLETLRTDLNARLQARLDAEAERERDAPLIAEVGQMRDTDPLAVMRAHVQRIAGLAPRTKEAQQTVQSRAAALESAITSAESFARGLMQRLDRVSTADALRQLQTEMQRRYERFRDTPEQALLDAADRRSTVLEQYLRKLHSVRPSSPPSPADAESVRASLSGIVEEANEHLSAEQRALAEKAQITLEGHVRQKQQEAIGWLESREQRIAKSDPGGLLRELANPPSFLPDECQSRLASIRYTLQSKIDEDEVQQVASRFGKIRDREKRRRCIEELVRIDEELSG